MTWRTVPPLGSPRSKRSRGEVVVLGAENRLGLDAPQAIRAASATGFWPLPWGCPLPVVDAGDVKAEALASTVRSLVRSGRVPVVLGGDHLVTLAAVRGSGAEQCLVLDAHHDCMGSGAVPTTADWLLHLPDDVVTWTMGVREGPPSAPVDHGRSWAHTGDWWAESRSLLGDHAPTWISIDLDVIDPLFAPAVDFPLAGGLTPREAAEALHVAMARHFVVGLDIVELSPSLPGATATAQVADHLLACALGGLRGRP